MVSLTPSFSPCLVAMNACTRALSLSGLLATSRSYWLPEQGCWGCVFWGRGGRGGRVGCRVWVMRPGLSGDLELQKGSHRDLQEMTWHTSLNPVGKTLRKSFLSQTTSLFTLQNEVALHHHSGTAASSANQVLQGDLSETPMAESGLADLLIFNFTLFSVNMSCACDLRRNHRWLCFFPQTSLTSNPKPKILSTHHSEEAAGGARACRRRDWGQTPAAKRKKDKELTKNIEI